MVCCPQCGAECVENTAYCAQCGACVGAKVDVSQTSNAQNTNPFDVGAQTSKDSWRNYDPDVPNIPGFVGAILTCFKKYCRFKGRASRSEYWYWTLFNFLMIGIALNMRTLRSYESDLWHLMVWKVVYLWNIVSFLPTLAVTFRRLHDVGRSGWYAIIFLLVICCWKLIEPVNESIFGCMFFVVVPFGLYMLILCCQRGTPIKNRYGLEPQKKR